MRNVARCEEWNDIMMNTTKDIARMSVLSTATALRGLKNCG